MRISRLVFSTLAAFAVVIGAAQANRASEMLSRLSDGERNKMLSRFMSASGEDCEAVDNFYQGSGKSGEAFWSVRCSGGKSFQIMIENDEGGSTKILECSALKVVANVSCFTKLN